MNDYSPSADLPASFREPCPHKSLDIRAFRCQNETTQYVYQCLQCGEKIGGPIKHAEVIAKRGPLEFIASFDDELREAYRNKLRSEGVRRISDVEAERIAKRAEDKARFDAWYSEYLQSPQWREKRELVMRRAAGVCEGCLKARADVVHHTTYEHVGNELLFELRALCRDCHAIAHGGAA
jgi:hypothetical protein